MRILVLLGGAYFGNFFRARYILFVPDPLFCTERVRFFVELHCLLPWRLDDIRYMAPSNLANVLVSRMVEITDIASISRHPQALLQDDVSFMDFAYDRWELALN